MVVIVASEPLCSRPPLRGNQTGGGSVPDGLSAAGHSRPVVSQVGEHSGPETDRGTTGGRRRDSDTIHRVLIIDDDPETIRVVSQALSADGIRVDSARGGRLGLSQARTGPYELVLLELLLPNCNGFFLLRDMIAARPDQRVLVVSALNDVQSKVTCLEIGAADFVAKPFELAELRARVRMLLRQPVPFTTEQRFLRTGRVTLELVTRVADSGNGPVRLSEREFLLLAHLMRRQGKVCTRKELLREVWGYQYDPGTNVVDVCVRRLRAKLGADVIQTMRAAGYCFPSLFQTGDEAETAGEAVTPVEVM